MLWLSMSTSPMTLTLDFQGPILKMLYLRNRRADWNRMKEIRVDRMLHPLCDLQLWPQRWHWHWIFKVKFWKIRISGIRWPIDMERKGGESHCDIKRWPHQCPRKLWRPCKPEDLQKYLNCRSCKSIACLNSRNQYNSHKLLPVPQDLQMLHLPVHPLYCQPGAEDLQILRRLPHPWPWPWIFKVKYWNCCNSGMGGSTHLEWKGCELDMMLNAQWDWP